MAYAGYANQTCTPTLNMRETNLEHARNQFMANHQIGQNRTKAPSTGANRLRLGIALSVSDESGQTAKPKRVLRPLTADQWNLARIQFETGDSGITLARIAAIFNTSRSSVEKRCAAGKWSKGLSIVKDARKQLQVATGNAMAKAADQAAQEVALRLTKELQPWIEKEKRAHIQRAVRRSKRALKRIDGIAEGFTVVDPKSGDPVEIKPGPKDEMCFATAEDKYDGIIRRNLGMNDSSPLSGALSVRVLTEGAAIEVQQG